LPDGNLLKVFPRATLDAALLEGAAGAGAVCVGARANAIERDADGWTIRTATSIIQAGWLLGADGPSGVIRKRVLRAFERRQLSVAAGSFVENATANEVVVQFLRDPPGYLWSFPRRDHLAVGACAQADRTSTAALHAIVDRWLDGYAPARGRRRQRYAWPIPSLPARDFDREQPAHDRWMLLGDAGGLVDPITREGIFFALQSGVFAARAIATGHPAATYSSLVRDEIHSELRRAARLRDMFFEPRFARLLIDALNHSAAIRRIMVDLIAGRQPYKGLRRRLLMTGELGLLWKLISE
jgi:flavin-dependent dehydrogenase